MSAFLDQGGLADGASLQLDEVGKAVLQHLADRVPRPLAPPRRHGRARDEGPLASESVNRSNPERRQAQHERSALAETVSGPLRERGAGRLVAEVIVRTDQELLVAVAAGDRAALRELHDRHVPWVAARLRRRCSDPDAVAEAVQDTFVAVWRSAGRWDGTGDPAAWIWGIAIRRLISALRTRSRWDRIKAVTEQARPEVVIATEDQVLQGVEHGDLAGALQRLSPELRAVMQATVLDGLTTREAGQLLGIPAGTVKTRMMRARAQLRGALA